MVKFLEHLLTRWSDAHLTDVEIIAELEAMPPAPLSARRRQHLSQCWTCLARKQKLQNTMLAVVEYEQALLAPFIPPPPNAEERLLARLHGEQRSPARSWFGSLVYRFPALPELKMNPVLATAVVVLLATAAVVAIWIRAGATVVSAHEFIQRVEESDRSRLADKDGVVFQRVRIRTPQRDYERSVYYDLRRRRHSRQAHLASEEELIKSRLAAAGVDWDDPLSAGSFLVWHDRSQSPEDSVAGGSGGLLTLTTDVSRGPVAAESLTVRNTDFHTVARTIQFRESGTIEIAELDYAVLAWNAVNDSIFEAPIPAEPPTPSSAILVPGLSAKILDEAELRARLALNRVNADATEPLVFSRSDTILQISGIVESAARKKELMAQLKPLPHVTASILSVDDIDSARPIRPAEISGGAQEADPDAVGPSPLSELYQKHDLNQADMSGVSRKILDSAVTIQQESAALRQLITRFPAQSLLNEEGRAARDELLTRHWTSLQNALAIQEDTITSVQKISAIRLNTPPSPQPSPDQDLEASVGRLRTLTTELISGSRTSPRAAEPILADMLESIADVRRAAHTIRTEFRAASQLETHGYR